MRDPSPDRPNVVCLVTCPVGEAETIARALVEEKHAACVNILPSVQSLYWWEGVVEKDEESLLVVKSTADLVGALTDQLRKVHPYDNFELVALSITDGSPEYLTWIGASVGASAHS
jgi:periplasmic divalent cation tolerance protein